MFNILKLENDGGIEKYFKDKQIFIQNIILFLTGIFET